MVPPSHPSQSTMPESLRQQIEGFRRHLWRIKVIEALAAGCIGLLVSFLLVYGLDRVWQTPVWARLLILAGGFSMFGIFAPYWLHRWVWRQRRQTQLARLIAKRYPGLGDRLLGVIELQDQQDSADVLSPRLREAAMQAVAAEAGRRNLTEALPPQRHRRWGLAALVLAAAVAAALAVTPRAALNALQRWALPFADTPRYTFTTLENPPQRLAVAYGEAFDVVLRLAQQSEQRPATGSARYGLQPGIDATLDGDAYRFTFPGQQEPGTVVFRIGDLRHELRVEPVLRPAAESVRAKVSAPAYLGIGERSVDLGAGAISAVEGSTIRITMEMSRPLASAAYGPTRPLQSGENDGVAVSHTPLAGELELAGNTASTPPLPVDEVSYSIPIVWRDRLGLAGAPGFSLRVDALKDAEPTCYLQGIDRQKVLLPEETVDFEVLAEDDFGVKVTGLEWSGQHSRPTDEAPAKGELQLATGTAEQQRLLATAAFSPAVFDIGPQRLTLRGYVEDAFPGRGRAYSEPVTLYILTRDEHAQMLKNQFDRQITELEDLARRELGLLEENERLERLDGQQLQEDENRQRLQQQEREESESARRSDDLTRSMEQLLKDATRNGEIDKKTLQKIAETLKSLQELSAADIPKVRDKLADSQSPSNTPEKSAQDVDQAVEQQRQALAKMQQAIDKANDANRRLEAGTFVNRLKKAASEQHGIANSLKEAFTRMLGVEFAVLDPSDIRRLNDNTRQQTQSAADVRWIQEDLAHYHARTGEEPFKQLLDEMRESGIDTGLEDIRGLLGDNHSYQAAEAATRWGDTLAAWANKLEGESGGASGGGGDGGGAPNAEDEDFEFMLRVMKMIQQEQDLRGRTRTLEQLRRDAGASAPQP